MNVNWNFMNEAIDRSLFAFYAEEDARKIQKALDFCNENGINLLKDNYEDAPGALWHLEIIESLKKSKALVLFLSDKSCRQKKAEILYTLASDYLKMPVCVILLSRLEEMDLSAYMDLEEKTVIRYSNGSDLASWLHTYMDWEDMPSFTYERSAFEPSQEILKGDASQMLICRPFGLDDIADIIQSLKAQRPVIISVESFPMETAQRIIDIIAGYLYMSDGNMTRISNGLFLVNPAPDQISIEGNFFNDLYKEWEDM